MREVLLETSCSYQKKFIGTKLQVLWEKAIQINETLWMLKGLADNYLRVRTFAPEAYHNQLMNVSIAGIQDEELFGKITPIQNQD
jgi:tRNA A37 methylthiotransferase MiaB